jgi:hypothetical protein
MQKTNNVAYDFIVCFSLVNLSFLTVWRELVFANNGDLYWMPCYTIQSYFAVLLNLFGWTFILWTCLWIVRKSDSHWLQNISRIAFLGLLVFPLNFARMALHIDSSTIYWLQDNAWITIPTGAAVALGGIYLLSFQLALVTKFVVTVLFILSPFGLITIGNSAWQMAAMASAKAQIPDEVHREPVSDNTASTQRVVWLIFDELDLRLAFLDRPPGIELPELERFSNESIFATNAESPSKNTGEAIPSYLFGQHVRGSGARSKGKLGFYLDADKQKKPFTWGDKPTVFGEARRLGATTAIMGIYHPYCRIFYTDYSYCSWHGINTYATQATNSLVREMYSQLTGITPVFRRINGVRTYEYFLEHAPQMAADPRYDFIYIHAPVPHGPDIYNERTGELTLLNTSKTGYFGNLILADRLFGKLRRSLEQANLWDSTAILLTADHEWRFSEQYDGLRTRKLPFLIKMPHQKSLIEVDTSFAPMQITKDMILDIMSGSLNRPEVVKSQLENGHS